MTLDPAHQSSTWIIVLITLAVCWPLAQSFRHDKLHPIAAYLLFVSVLALVSASVFWVLILVGSAVVGSDGLNGAAPAAIVVLVSLVPGLAAARWIVRRPQERRMPK